MTSSHELQHLGIAHGFEALVPDPHSPEIVHLRQGHQLIQLRPEDIGNAPIDHRYRQHQPAGLVQAQ